jgi:hypothetical protein
MPVGGSCHLWSCTDKLVLSPQLLQQRPGLLQVGGVKALSEPAIERGQQLAGCGAFVLVLPQPAQAHRRPQFQRLGLLAAGHGEGVAQRGKKSRQQRGIQIGVPEGILHREPLGLGSGHQTIIAGDIRAGQRVNSRSLLHQRFL